MIEIYAIYRFCKLLGKWLRAKGYQPLGYQLALILLWFVMEFSSAALYFILFRRPEGTPVPAYLFALGGAGAAVAILLALAKELPDKRLSGQSEAPVDPVELERDQAS